MNKPVYIKNSEIQMDKNKKIGDYESIHKKVCRVCKEPGHAPGSSDCRHHEESPDNVVAFQGQDNPLYDFFPCDLRVFGEHHKTAEHAYQLTKAIRSGNTDAAQKVRDAETALDVKRIGNSVKDPQGWSDDKETVMEEIVTAKADQIAEVKAVLEKLDESYLKHDANYHDPNDHNHMIVNAIDHQAPGP
uniref:NADAR domain-containing protein n=1 Tax=Magallana gigas TaxID=29159 RepID=A0A8W8J5A4_MAGGI